MQSSPNFSVGCAIERGGEGDVNLENNQNKSLKISEPFRMSKPFKMSKLFNISELFRMIKLFKISDSSELFKIGCSK
jgi:hypothetical protein